MGAGKRILDAVTTALLLAAVAAVAVWLVLPRVGIQPLVVLSGSMEPELKLGGVVFVERISPDDVRVGDILTFTQPGATESPLVTHRVARVERDATSRPQFITRGDANSTEDPWIVRAEAVRGVARADLPYIGYFAQFVRRPLGFALILGLPAAMLAGAEIWGVKKPSGAAAEEPSVEST